MDGRHVLLVTFPAQGHINPALQFAKRLVNRGIQVTFATSINACRRMEKAAAAFPKGLNLASFSDGYDDGFKPGDDAQKYMTEIRSRGAQFLKDTLLAAAAGNGTPVTCLVYSLLLPWASEVARQLHIPSALLWIQPATVLGIYYYYFNGFADEITANLNNPTWKIQFPGFSFPMAKSDLPSFLVTSGDSTYAFAIPTFKEQLDDLDKESRPKILVNTFDALEPDTIKAIGKYEMIGIGPLIPSAFVYGRDPSDKSFGGDLFQKSGDDYLQLQWLSTNPESSVVYVSFGSLLRLSKAQKEEIAKGLLSSNRPFLWVILDNDRGVKDGETGKEGEDDEKLSCIEELESLGKIVPWCSQLEVLTHPSLGCFVSHCGWNSTLESLSCGVPVVAFPHWTDQGTNAKLIADVWRSGVRVRVNEDSGMVESEEIRRCVEEVMDGGEKSQELRENAKKWKVLARESMAENGSSSRNLEEFLQRFGETVQE